MGHIYYLNALKKPVKMGYFYCLGQTSKRHIFTGEKKQNKKQKQAVWGIISVLQKQVSEMKARLSEGVRHSLTKSYYFNLLGLFFFGWFHFLRLLLVFSIAVYHVVVVVIVVAVVLLVFFFFFFFFL